MMPTEETEWRYQDEVKYWRSYFFIGSPIAVPLIWITYMLLILKIGPKFMKNRPAYNLDNIMTVYNVIQVLISAYLLNKGLPMVWKIGLSPLKCYYDKDFSVDYLQAGYIYFLSKIVELLDTVFFVLRKKFSQASFLHVYHHSTMVIFLWIILRYDPHYVLVYPATLNSFVHLIMYTYYGLSAFPSLTRYLWWKKYITSLQLVQFVLVIIMVIFTYNYGECPPSLGMVYHIIIHGVIFLILFTNFYVNTYWKPKQIREKVFLQETDVLKVLSKNLKTD